MHKYELLRQRADEFLQVLETYAKTDSDVEWLLDKYRPWYEKIQQRKIRLPVFDFKVTNCLWNVDISPLADRYGIGNPIHPIATTAAELGSALRDDLSDPIYMEKLKSHGEKPSAILDELPPPDEELPL